MESPTQASMVAMVTCTRTDVCGEGTRYSFETVPPAASTPGPPSTAPRSPHTLRGPGDEGPPRLPAGEVVLVGW